MYSQPQNLWETCLAGSQQGVLIWNLIHVHYAYHLRINPPPKRDIEAEKTCLSVIDIKHCHSVASTFTFGMELCWTNHRLQSPRLLYIIYHYCKYREHYTSIFRLMFRRCCHHDWTRILYLKFFSHKVWVPGTASRTQRHAATEGVRKLTWSCQHKKWCWYHWLLKWMRSSDTHQSQRCGTKGLGGTQLSWSCVNKMKWPKGLDSRIIGEAVDDKGTSSCVSFYWCFQHLRLMYYSNT